MPHWPARSERSPGVAAAASIGATIRRSAEMARTMRIDPPSSRSERKPHLDFVMTQFGDRCGRHQRAAADDARLPLRKPVRLIIPLDVLPIGLDKIAVPLVERGHADQLDNLAGRPFA